MNSLLELTHTPQLTMSDECLRLYDRLGRSYCELDCYRGDDFDVVKDAVDRFHARYVMDCGCGPGVHVRYLLDHAEVVGVVAVDFSTTMVQEARTHIAAEEVESATFLVHNICKPLPQIGAIDAVICMNNVLGNVVLGDIDSAAEARTHVVKNISAVLHKRGCAVFSVYNRKYMPLHSIHTKSNRFHIAECSRDATGDLIVEYHDDSAQAFHYYSHWFTTNEIRRLIERDGSFKVLDIYERDSRILVVAERK